MTRRDEVLREIQIESSFCYPLRWADEHTSVGDFEGRDLTIEIFNIPSCEQRSFFRELRRLRTALSVEFDRAITFIYHTPDATEEFYSHLFPKTTEVAFEDGITVKLLPGGFADSLEVEGPVSVVLPSAA